MLRNASSGAGLTPGISFCSHRTLHYPTIPEGVACRPVLEVSRPKSCWACLPLGSHEQWACNKQGESLYSRDPWHNRSTTGVLRRAVAMKEVIRSAGVMNTPTAERHRTEGRSGEAQHLLHREPHWRRGPPYNPEMLVVGVARHGSESIPEPGDPVCTRCSTGDPCVSAWLEGRGPDARAAYNMNAVKLKSNHSSTGQADRHVFAIPYAFQGY
ncbi:hypothetical protein GE09DRAFT_727508 [Coniochaeta sp. 2T2.1]|nr:hypothetical protein GE09DRAFT_727508 [Coniochaeta sp. 2T2.1]